MTNLEKYNKIMKECFRCTDEELNDEVLVYNRHPRWDSVTHMDLVSELEEKFDVMFETLDITGFNKYSKGIETLRALGVDM